MENALLLSFGWMVLAAAFAGLIAAKFRLPPPVLLLLAGMIIGPSFFHLIDVESVDFFAQVGSILLLFMIGIEFSIPKLLSIGLRAVISSLILFFITFIVMHEAALLLGFGDLESLFIAAMFSMSSTALIMRILEQEGFSWREEVPVLVGMLVIEDMIAVFLLALFSGLRGGSFSPEELVRASFTAFAILGISYIVLLKVLESLAEFFFKEASEDVKVLFAFALGLGMSGLASMLGLSPAIGAFLAGSLMSAVPNCKDLERSVRPFGLVFSAFFFLSVGMFISPAALGPFIPQLLLIILIFMAIVLLATGFTFYLQSSSGRSATFAGLAMLPLSEFALLLAQNGPQNLSFDPIGFAAVGVLLTSITCAFTINHHESLYLIFRNRLPIKLLSTMTHASKYFRSVIAAFEPGGYFHKLCVAEFRKSASDALFLVWAGLFYWLSVLNFHYLINIGGGTFYLDSFVLFIMILLSLIPISRIFLSFKRLFDALSTIFSRTTPQSSKQTILRNLIISAVLFAIFANFYLVIAFLHLPPAFLWLSLLFGAGCIFFLWSAIRALSLGFFLSEGQLGSFGAEPVKALDEDVVFIKGNNYPSKRSKSSKAPVEDLDEGE